MENAAFAYSPQNGNASGAGRLPTSMLRGVTLATTASPPAAQGVTAGVARGYGGVCALRTRSAAVINGPGAEVARGYSRSYGAMLEYRQRHVCKMQRPGRPKDGQIGPVPTGW